jgi:DNA-binding NarL/FixJ family response regulator
VAVRHISRERGETLTRADLRSALALVQRLADAGDPDEFAAETMRGLAELVPCDYASYVETNPAAGRALAMTSPREAMFSDAPEALARNLDEHPLIRFYAETGELRSLKMSDFLTQRQFRRLRLYDEVFAPADTNYLLTAALPVPRELVVGFSLHRSRRDFSERDRALVDLLQPHLARAYELALLRSVVGSVDEAVARGDPSVVVLALDGSVLWATRDAQRRLLLFGPLGPDGLPAAVSQWLASGAERSLVGSFGRRRVRIDSLGGRPAALHVVERAVTPSIESLLRMGLSRREAQVLALVVEGCGNAEIARHLSVSPGTVKRHLENIYEKLGVHTRTAAAAAAWAGGDAPTAR